jgi:long-chain acyl-CoA synthetase
MTNSVLAALQKRAFDDVVIEDRDGAHTAGQLRADIESLRSELVGRGIDRLGLLAGNSAAWIIADLACQAAGICLLPLPVFFSDSQLVNSVRAVGVAAVLTDDPVRIRGLLSADELADGDSVPDSLVFKGLELLQLTGCVQQPIPPGTHKITFTSGSTGAPRGVCLGVEQQLSVANALNASLHMHAPRHLCLLPLSTLLENIGGIYAPLLAGGTIVSPPETDTGFSGSTGLDLLTLIRAVSRHRPASIILLPQMLVGLLAAIEQGWKPPAELQFVAVGGAKAGADLIERARNHGLPVYEGYGLSESASVACLNIPGVDKPGSVGRPLEHLELAIEADEIVIYGNSFLGYVGDPGSWGQQRVATGDLGEIDEDGFVHIRGRSKNVLISSFGRNIAPEWIESELLQHAALAQCIVFGDSRPYCIALIVAADSAADDAAIQRVIDSANRDLPDYARIIRWHRLPEKLTAVDGLFTANGRPRRAAIETEFEAEIMSLYTDSLPGSPAVRSVQAMS